MKTQILCAVLVVSSLVACDLQKNPFGKTKPSDVQEAEAKASEKIQQIRREEAQALSEIRQDQAVAANFVREKAEQGIAKEREKVVEKRQELVAEESKDAQKLRAYGIDPSAGPVLAGTLTNIASNKITIRDDKGVNRVVVTNDSTRVRQGGEALVLENCVKGTPVKAKVEVKSDEVVARELEVLEKGSCHLPHKKSHGHGGNREGLDPMDLPLKSKS